MSRKIDGSFAVANRAGEPGIAGTDAAGLSRESFVLCGGAKSWGSPSNGSALRGAGVGLWAAVARRWRQANATRLAPRCLIDFLLVADCQATGRFRCDEDRVTHFPARTTVLGLNFLPKPNPSKFEFRKFFFDLPAQAIFIAFSRSLAPSGKHPKAAALSSYEQHPSAFRSHQFRGFRHSL